MNYFIKIPRVTILGNFQKNKGASIVKKIGMVVAVEIDAVLNKFGVPKKEIPFIAHSVYEYKLGEHTLFVINSGVGQIAATMATQFLITEFDVDLIVNFGVVGGLTPEMEVTKTCIVESVVHYDFDTSSLDKCEVGRYLEYPSIYIPTSKQIMDKALDIEPSLKKVVCASGDKFIDGKKEKERLHQLYKADICEMEAAGIVLTCNKYKTPCLLIKTVSDGISGGAEEFVNTIHSTAETCLEITIAVLSEI